MGSYGGSGPAAYLGLELHADGSYACLVLTGLTADGCGTLEGAGESIGSWRWRDGSLSFAATNEPSGLAVHLSDASAVPSRSGLVLTTGGADYVLARKPARTALD